MCAEWWQTRPCIKDRSVGHVSTAGWIMLQSLHCIHLYAALCYLPPILLLLSHCRTGYWATHLVVTQAPRDWPLDVVTVRYSYSHDTEVRWWLTAVQWFLRWAPSSRKTWSVLTVIAGSSDIENMSAGGGFVKFPGNHRYCGGWWGYNTAVAPSKGKPWNLLELKKKPSFGQKIKCSVFAS